MINGHQVTKCWGENFVGEAWITSCHICPYISWVSKDMNLRWACECYHVIINGFSKY